MKIETDTVTFSDLFEKKDVKYIIPAFQRDYSWKKEQNKELWEDILNALKSNLASYFLGPVTVLNENKSNKEFEIIDGQQRFSTIYILLSVILEISKQQQFDCVERIKKIREDISRLLSSSNFGSTDIYPKLRLNEHNRNFFNDYIVDIQNRNLTPEDREKIIANYKNSSTYDYNIRLKEAYDALKSFVMAYIKDQDEETTIDMLVELSKYIIDNIELVMIVVEEEADAYMIFESLNDRGLELSQVDLVKNKLFKNLSRNCSSQSREFESHKEKWNQITKNLHDQDTIMKYLVHYWRTTYKHLTKKTFFNACRNEIGNDYDISLVFLNNLKEHSKVYYSILNPIGAECWGNDTELIFTLDWMQRLGYTSVIPLILATLIRYPSKKDYVKKITLLSFNFLVRYVSVSKNKISNVEKNISEFAQKLRNSTIDFNDWLKEVSEFFLKNSTDYDFKSKLRLYTVEYDSSQEQSNLGYYLVSIYDKFHPNRNDSEAYIIPERRYLTLEHILPQTVKANTSSGEYWLSQFGDEIENYKNLLGNFALLNREAQARCGNSEYRNKLITYKEHADSKITTELYENDDYNKDWNPDALNKRQEVMVDVISKHISLDIKYL